MPRCLRTGEILEPTSLSVEAKETPRFSDFMVDRHNDPATSCPRSMGQLNTKSVGSSDQAINKRRSRGFICLCLNEFLR